MRVEVKSDLVTQHLISLSALTDDLRSHFSLRLSIDEAEALSKALAVEVQDYYTRQEEEFLASL